MFQMILYRLSRMMPRLSRMFKRLNIIINNVEISDRAHIGRNFRLVHGIGTVIGKCRIGDNVRIYQNVTIGAKHQDEDFNFPVIEDDVIIFANSVIVGNIRIGKGSVIGAMSFVDKDIPPKSLVFTKKELIIR